MKKAIVLFVFLYTFVSCAWAQKPPQVKNFSSQVELCYCVGTPSNYHVKLRWDLIPKCTRYFVYRVAQGTKPDYNKPYVKLTNNENIFIDRNVKYQDKWDYYVCGVVPSGYLQFSNVSTAIIPLLVLKNPEAPTNLRTVGFWNNGAYDNLVWDKVSDAVSYNIYRYDTKIGSSATNSFIVDKYIWQGGWTYTVTAVDKNGLESLPSNLGMATGQFDPNYNFTWTSNFPANPGNYITRAEWNNDKPRNFIKWQDTNPSLGSPESYNVYRDGVKIATGLWPQYYIDKDVLGGKTYRYTISSINHNRFTEQETFGASVDITTSFGPPAPISTPVNITGFVPNDDSVVVKFDLVPGAVDYRVYVANNPNSVKYSSGHNMIEMNGLISNQSYDLIVEALDKFGPYQKIDGMIGPGASGVNGEIHAGINGHGDPSNNPIVLTKSAPYKVNTIQRSLSGEQVFFDNFRNFQPIVQLPQKPEIVQYRLGGPGTQWWDRSDLFLKWYENDKWNFFLDDLDTNHSTVFLMGSHFMDTLYDGATMPVPGWAHQSNGVMLMSPKKTANIAGSKVLHVTFEVDPHFSSRRWCDILLLPAGEVVYSGKAADKIGMNSKSGKLFRWTIGIGSHVLNVDTGYNPDGSRKSYSIPIKYASRAGASWELPSPYRKVDYRTEYKVGTFAVDSVNDSGSVIEIKWTAKFNDGGKFPAFTLSSGAVPKSTWIKFGEFGTTGEYEITSDSIKVLDDINFSSDNWWIKQSSKESVIKLMDAYCSTRTGSMIYRAIKNPASGKFEGDIFFRPSVERQNFSLNRTWQGLDRRVQFDLYVSKNRVVITEDGYLVADSPLPVDFPFDEINVNYTHLIYHTQNEVQEQRTYSPDNSYWINFRPFADERHWDNMGFEVLTSFPDVKLL